MSSQVWTADWCQKAQTLGSSVMLPIQVNFVASNCWPAVRPSSLSIGSPRAKVAITVPSLGATL